MTILTDLYPTIPDFAEADFLEQHHAATDTTDHGPRCSPTSPTRSPPARRLPNTIGSIRHGRSRSTTTTIADRPTFRLLAGQSKKEKTMTDHTATASSTFTTAEIKRRIEQMFAVHDESPDPAAA